VRWDSLPEDVTNGVITGYRVRYRQNKDRRQIIVAVDGTQSQCILTGKYASSTVTNSLILVMQIDLVLVFI